MSSACRHEQEVFCPLKDVLDWLDTMMARIEFDTYGQERGCQCYAPLVDGVSALCQLSPFKAPRGRSSTPGRCSLSLPLDT